MSRVYATSDHGQNAKKEGEVRLASFNVENLFERVKPMNDTDWKAGREILTVWAELNGLFAKPAYSAADQKNFCDRSTSSD